MEQPVELKVRGPRKAVTARLQTKLDSATRKLRKAQLEIIQRYPQAGSVVFKKDESQTKSTKELVAEFLDDPSIRKTTLSRRRDIMEGFLAHSLGEPLSRGVYERWLKANIGSNLAPGTKALQDRVVRRFLNWAANTGRVPEKYHTGIKCVQQPKQVARPTYSKEEVEKLISFAENQYPDLAFIIQLLWFTGMAISDCVFMTWGEVDMDRCVIRKGRNKTGEPLVVPFEFGGALHNSLVRMQLETIRVYGEIKPGYPVCRRYSLAISTVRVHFNKLVKEVGIPYRSFHSLRSTFISDCVNNGVAVPVAMKLTGIKNVSVFAAYATIKDDKLRDDLSNIR